MTWQSFLATLKGGHRAYPLDRNGDGIDELVFTPPSDENIHNEKPALIAMSPDFYRFRAGNFTGSNSFDVAMISEDSFYIYENPGSISVTKNSRLPLGTGTNVSYDNIPAWINFYFELGLRKGNFISQV